MADVQTIVMKNFDRGGIADSKFSGAPDSVAMMVGMDIHSEPGVANINQQLDKNSGTTVTELCLADVPCSKGLRYWFSSESGKIWEDNDGTWTLVHTTVPTSGEAKCLDAIEYEGYIYWATQNYIHRITVRGIGGATFWTNNAELNWMELNLDQDVLGGSGATYALTTGVNEGATHKLLFTPREETIIGIGLYVVAKGTGNITIKIHDSANAEQKSVTINNISLVNGQFNYFAFSSDWNPDPNTEYHIHVYSSVADATVSTLTVSDFATGYAKIFTEAADDRHPMVIQNLVLYIGDRQYIHQIETFRGVTTASNFALDIPKPYHVTDVEGFETDLIIGTRIDNDVREARVFRWNTWSTTYSSTDGVDEVGIRAFIRADNYLFAIAGTNGKIFFYNGAKLEPVKKIPGTYSPDQTIDVHPNSITTFMDVQMFGVSNLLGNAAKQGLWSFGNTNLYYPKVLNLEFPISKRIASEFVLEDLTIGAVMAVGNDLYVAWKWDNGVDTAETGVDKINYNVKLDKAYIESRVLTNHRHLINTYQQIIANYVELSDNANIELYYKRNYEATWHEITDNKYKDVDRVGVTANINLTAAPLELRIIFRRDTEDTSLAPKIESIYITVD